MHKLADENNWIIRAEMFITKCNQVQLEFWAFQNKNVQMI